MIRGLGTDLIETARIAEKINKNMGFRELVFSPAEIEYCGKMANQAEHYAGRFAVKEAFLKALGTGWTDGVRLNEIQVINDSLGRPEIQLLGETLKTVSALAIGKISVSLSHLKEIASAVVIIEDL